MKILLVLNKPNREIPIMESIKREIMAVNRSAVVDVKEMCETGFVKYVFMFRPNVILTFPFTCKGFSHWYYIFKFFLGCKIITLRAEGVVDFDNEYNVQWAVGFDNYGDSLVDFELFWGEKLAKEVGNQLLKQQKISSIQRVKVVGYPRLEAYADKSNSFMPALPVRIEQKISIYKKDKIALFVTGFHLANYSKQDLYDAKDLDAENMLDQLLEGVEISKRFRQEWIDNILEASIQNPEILILVKKHPIEKRQNYEIFEGVENILFIYEDIQVEQIISYASVFFHYGSTALVDSYLAGIPAVYVFSQHNKQWYPDMGWPSSLKVMVSEIPKALKESIAGKTKFEMNAGVEVILKDIFGIEKGRAYRPSKEIARIILDPSPPQKISLTDTFFIKSIFAVFWNSVCLRLMHKLKLSDRFEFLYKE